MSEPREHLVQRFLVLTGEFFDKIAPSLSLDRLASDITVAQLRILFVLRNGGPSPMSVIASEAGVVPSTATGIVDNLVGKGLVLRENDPDDRRRVICRLSSEGQFLVNGLWTWGRDQIEGVLESLTVEQLENGCEVIEVLLQLPGDEFGKD